MFCDPLDIPDEIIAAQEAGELVIFVGAGVSFEGQSNLPLFDGLTDQIGSKIGKVRDAARKDYDVLLGEWQDSHGVRVHAAAHEIIANPQSRPNEAHRLLLRLFKKPEHLRIVTTNYDRHFTTAATELRLTPPVYRAPALPLGDDFHGIVFLHGSVEDKPERLVLTDADFGKAYLIQGWARTFLQALYARFHVLFVGYSHADSLLSYLARGLPTRDRRRRHAIQVTEAKGDFARWCQLGIDVIPYQHPHANLDKGLARWVQFTDYQPQDVRERIRQIIDGVEGPALVPGSETAPMGDSPASTLQLGRDAEDFLGRAFRNPVHTGWFTERARDLRWIAWLRDAKYLPLLTDQASLAELNEIKGQLIGWAVRLLVSSAEPEALALFVTLGGNFGPIAWWWAVQTLLAEKDDTAIWSSPHLDRWLTAIRHACGARVDHSLVANLIEILAAKGKTEHSLGLFNKLLQVRVEWKTSWSAKPTRGAAEPEAKLAVEHYDLTEAWTALQPLRDRATDERLLRMLTACIEEIYAAHGSLQGRLDPVAGMRIVVDETRGNYDPHDAEDFVPVMFLELIKSLGTAPGGIGEERISHWLAAPQAGWHRFALYALRMDATMSPARKAQILFQHGLIYPANWQLQHDPETLVSAIYADLAQADKRRVLEIIVAGPKLAARKDLTLEKIAETEQRIRDGFLRRLAHKHQDDAEIFAAFARIGLKLPPPLPDPSQIPPIKNGFDLMEDEARSPRTIQALLENSAESQIDFFLTYQDDGTNAWSGPSRVGLLAAVLAAANQNPEWARSLIDGLIARGITHGDLWDRVVLELNWHDKEAAFRRWFLLEVTARVNPTEWTLNTWHTWTSHLLQLSDQKTLQELSTEEWDILVEWSLRAWQATRAFEPDEDAAPNPGDAFTRAINNPAGKAVGFWLSYASHQRQSDPTTPYVWPPRLQQPVAQLLAADDDTRLLGLAVFGQNLSFVRYAFPDWTRATLYPLLDLRESSRLGLCLWTAWLHYGRLSAELAAELPPFMEQAHNKLLSTEKETPHRLMIYMTVIATSPFAPDDCVRWLRAILANASPAQRKRWISQVAKSVRELPAERRNEVWTRWAREHLKACQLGQFGATSREEFAEFLHWPLAFASVGEEAFELVKQLPPHQVKKLNVIHELKQSGLAKQNPDFTASYLHWLFETVAQERYGYYKLNDVIAEMVVTTKNRAALSATAARLLALGCTQESEALSAKIQAPDS